MGDVTNGTTVQKVAQYRYTILYLSICLVILLGIFLADTLTKHTNPWGDDKNADSSFCEHVYQSDLLREKSNSYSNLSIFYCGIYCFLCSYLDLRFPKNVHKSNSYNIGYFWWLEGQLGIALMFLGFGSFYMHARISCEDCHHFDVGGTYFVVWALVVTSAFFILLTHKFISPDVDYNHKRLVIVTEFFYFAGLVLAIHYEKLEESIGVDTLEIIFMGIFGLLLTLLAFGVYGARRNSMEALYDYFLVPCSALSLVIAVVCWLPEEVLDECKDSKRSGLELHAMWHSFLGIAIWFAVLYCRAVDRPYTIQYGLWATIIFKLPLEEEELLIESVDTQPLLHNQSSHAEEDAENSSNII